MTSSPEVPLDPFGRARSGDGRRHAEARRRCRRCLNPDERQHAEDHRGHPKQASAETLAQACGLVQDHVTSCFRFKELLAG
jgi:hypothetical protein